jgi:uncharacterized protein YndB with AHSA1/START domain
MKTVKKKLKFRFERTIAASPSEVYDAWLNPKITGTPWNGANKLILNPQVDGFYYLLAHGFSHYGRFTTTERPNRVQHTWVSPHTLGEESTVTVTFKERGEKTLMTLVHSDLPNTDGGRAHEDGWNYYLDIFPEQFGMAHARTTGGKTLTRQ